MINVVILGSGNLATHLFKAITASKTVKVTQWYARRYETISGYANSVATTDQLRDITEADVYIIAVSDDAIKTLSAEIPFSNRLVVHTSGSASIHELDKKLQRGVFYPLQSFSKNSDVNFSEVPICLEVLEKENLLKLKNLAEALGCSTYKINTEQRQTLHVSAVFVNNFVNQLYRIAHEISDAKNINFEILKPLIMETARKIQTMSPYAAQTGPAIRNDKKTIKRHLKQLENEQHKAIYQLLSNSIKQTHGIR